ncbi:hypothetical protein BDW22DRAFT_1426721 [Trametopsis cervina]|nr:hypothetical protein BDW22DRAFT_1426721 [Trametopsis cervina]
MATQRLTVKVRQLSKDACEADVDAATSVMDDAFADDCLYNILLGGHFELLSDCNRAQIKAALVGGLVYVAETESGDAVGAAVWFGPGQELLESEGQSEQGFDQFMSDLGKAYPEMPAWWTDCFWPAYGAFNDKAYGGPEYKHSGWHLQLLGVRNDFQRRGIGSALVRFVEENVIANSPEGAKHMVVETETEDNLAFYKAIGFVVQGEILVEGEKKMSTTVPMWTLSKVLA